MDQESHQQAVSSTSNIDPFGFRDSSYFLLGSGEYQTRPPFPILVVRK